MIKSHIENIAKSICTLSIIFFTYQIPKSPGPNSGMSTKVIYSSFIAASAVATAASVAVVVSNSKRLNDKLSRSQDSTV